MTETIAIQRLGELRIFRGPPSESNTLRNCTYPVNTECDSLESARILFAVVSGCLALTSYAIANTGDYSQSSHRDGAEAPLRTVTPGCKNEVNVRNTTVLSILPR